jgi:hypothetical protein
MDAGQFEVISKKLDAIIALLALDKLAEKSKTDSILMLNQYGLDYATIALIVGTTPKAVAARVSDSKKAKGSKDSRKDKVAKVNHQEDEPELGISSEGMPA